MASSVYRPLDENNDNDNLLQTRDNRLDGSTARSETNTVDDSSWEEQPGNGIPMNQIASLNNVKENREDDAKSDRNPWKPGVGPRFPWAGIASLFLILALTGAAIAVLLVSNGSPVSNWVIAGTTVQPQVWVSVISTVMDMLTAFALMEGAIVSFWREAGRGTKLSKLFYIYENVSVGGALNRLVRGKFEIVGLACLVAAMSALRSPLFQRSSTIDDLDIYESRGMNTVKMAQVMPPGFLYGNGTVYSAGFIDAYDGFTRGSTIRIQSLASCSYGCQTSVKAFGFWPTCTTTTITIEEAKDLYSDPTESTGGTIPVFNVSAAIPGDDAIYINGSTTNTNKTLLEELASKGVLRISSLFKTAPNCKDNISLTTCDIHQALIEYSVIIRQESIELRNPQWQNDTFLHYTPPWNEFKTLDIGEPDPFHSLLPWLNFLVMEFGGEYGVSTIGGEPEWSTETAYNTMIARQSIIGDGYKALRAMNCSVQFRDPTQEVLNRLRDMTFRLSAIAANTTSLSDLFFAETLISPSLPLIQNWTQTVPYLELANRVVFKTNTAYLVTATVISILGVLAIAPLYYGWWELGREASFNPLEIAKAFDAVILREVDCNAVKEGIVKDVGRKEVTYGVEGGGEGKLRMVDGVHARRPYQNERF